MTDAAGTPPPKLDLFGASEKGISMDNILNKALVSGVAAPMAQNFLNYFSTPVPEINTKSKNVRYT